MSYCSKCGETIYYGILHYCKPPFQIISNYNYKCPSCKGEFNSPTISLRPNTANVSYYRCPFCGRLMDGMNI